MLVDVKIDIDLFKKGLLFDVVFWFCFFEENGNEFIKFRYNLVLVLFCLKIYFFV